MSILIDSYVVVMQKLHNKWGNKIDLEITDYSSREFNYFCNELTNI